MWSDAGGGGFNTSFGGDDGGGYGTQQFASPGPEVKRSQGRKIERVLPLTIRTVLNLDENSQDYLGTQVNMVIVIGLIREVDVTSTKITYTLDDTTGTIRVIKWLDSEAEEDPLMENTYCRVHGTFKTYQGNKQLLALHVEHITDLNWVTSHMLEVVHTALQLKKIQNEASSSGIGKGGAMSTVGGSGVMANSMVGFGGLGGPGGIVVGDTAAGMGGSSMLSSLGLTSEQKLVFEVIRSALGEYEDSGYSRELIKSRLKNKVAPQKIDEVLFFLSNEGHIYTTVDEDHFKSTDG